MLDTWESHLARWTEARLVETDLRDRILVWERDHQEPRSLRWPVRIALAFGAILLGAGVLLFVSAHWDQLSPSGRMSLIVAMVAAFHIGGSVSAGRFEGLSIALHTLGTVALGGAIALAGQIFNLSEHWPSAVLLWAIGAATAWALLGHWTQGALTAILVPYWLIGEWSTVTEDHVLPITVGVCALSFVYLSARRGSTDSALRKALGWIGGIALLPSVLVIGVDHIVHPRTTVAPNTLAVAWTIAIAIPLAVAILLRGRDAIWPGVAIAWTLVLANMNNHHLAIYLWCALGSVGLALWGTRESRPERINLGILGFGATVLAFYFSDVMDKLDRATGLILVGLLFLVGGWLLEGTRRRLMAHIQQEAI